jgi:hypothetical protein
VGAPQAPTHKSQSLVVVVTLYYALHVSITYTVSVYLVTLSLLYCVNCIITFRVTAENYNGRVTYIGPFCSQEDHIFSLLVQDECILCT